MREILFRGQTRRKGEKVRMDGSPVESNWVYGGVLCGSELVMYLKELRDARKLIESQAHYIGAYIDDEFRRR